MSWNTTPSIGPASTYIPIAHGIANKTVSLITVFTAFFAPFSSFLASAHAITGTTLIPSATTIARGKLKRVIALPV